MTRLDRALGLFVTERRFVHEQVRVSRHLDRGCARTRVARDDDAPAGPRRTNELRRIDRAAVGERHRQAAMYLSPERALRNSHLACELRIEAALPRLLDERVA